MDRATELIPEVKAFMRGIEGIGNDLCVVLVGSAARETQTENSDVDLLVISKEPTTDLDVPRRVHLVRATYDDFLKQLERGEDFEAWCVRLGVPVHDNGLWSEILARPESKVWPSWRKKVVHGATRLFLASELIEIGDPEASAEELLYTTGHIARGLLLKNNVFPLSRPELEDQVRAIGYPHLAAMHQQLRTNADNDGGDFLRRCQLYSKRLLVHLSAEDYRNCSKEIEKKKRTKLHKKANSK